MMKINEAITILKEHNKWRRGTPPYDEVGNRQPYSAKDIGLAIDCIVEELEGISGNQMEIPPKFDADYLQSKIDAHTRYMQEHGITSEQQIAELDEMRGYLTWQDIKRIVNIADEYIKFVGPTTTEQEYYEQVLKRFREE